MGNGNGLQTLIVRPGRYSWEIYSPDTQEKIDTGKSLVTPLWEIEIRAIVNNPLASVICQHWDCKFTWHQSIVMDIWLDGHWAIVRKIRPDLT
jgi:hypothetical protein